MATADHGATNQGHHPMLADISDLIIAHAPAYMLGDAGIVILCAWTLSTACLYHYAKSKGAI